MVITIFSSGPRKFSKAGGGGCDEHLEKNQSLDDKIDILHYKAVNFTNQKNILFGHMLFNLLLEPLWQYSNQTPCTVKLSEGQTNMGHSSPSTRK